MRLQFSGAVFEWRGPAPHHFVALSPEVADAVASVSARASYGWGCIPVLATVGDTSWRTSLIPKDGGYLLPLRVSVRAAEGIAPGQTVAAELVIDP